MHSTLSRRGFLTTLSSAGVAGVTGTPGVFAQEAPPEITTIRLAKNQSLCIGRNTSLRICFARKALPPSAI